MDVSYTLPAGGCARLGVSSIPFRVQRTAVCSLCAVRHGHTVWSLIPAVCVTQDFIDLYFPTREIFAALSPFMLRVTPRLQDRIAAFKQHNFGLFTIGLQVGRASTFTRGHPVSERSCCSVTSCTALLSHSTMRRVLPVLGSAEN